MNRSVGRASRRAWLGASAASLAWALWGCKLGPAGAGGAGSPSGGPTGIVEAAYLPKHAELEAKVKSALDFAGGRPEPLILEMLKNQAQVVAEAHAEAGLGGPAPPTKPFEPAPLGTMIAMIRKGGGELRLKSSTTSMQLEAEVEFKKAMPPDLIGPQTLIDMSIERLEEAREFARLEATYRHLDLVLEMASHRRQGGDFDGRADEFRRILEVARAADAVSALTISVMAATRGCADGKIPPEKLDELLAQANSSFPITGAATEGEARALYDALETSFDEAIAALKQTLRDRFPKYLHAQSDANIDRMFAPYRDLATAEPMAPAAPPPATGGPSSPGVVTGGADLAGMAEAGSALFPGLGVVAAGVGATTQLLEGNPRGAIEVAATMVPGGSTALAVVDTALGLLGG